MAKLDKIRKTFKGVWKVLLKLALLFRPDAPESANLRSDRPGILAFLLTLNTHVVVLLSGCFYLLA